MGNNGEITLFFAKSAVDSKRTNAHAEVRERPEPLVVVGKKEKTLVPASEASIELCRAQGMWPFDFFPDTLIIEEKRIIIKRRTFPFYTTTITIPLSKVLMFELTHSIFFSSVYLKGYIGYNIEATFQWLSHSEAQRIKDVVDGLRLKENEAIEILERDRRNLSYTLEKLGHAF